MQKTTEELDALKKNWMNDPCWDIETEEGFEDYKDELLAYRKEQEAEWQHEAEERIARRARVVAIETGVTNSEIQKNILTFAEINNDIQNVIKRTESDAESLMISQVHATLLLAAQMARIADALENMESTDSLSKSVRIWGSGE